MICVPKWFPAHLALEAPAILYQCRNKPFETLIPLIKPLFDGLRAVKNFFRKENEEKNRKLMVAAEKVAAVA